MLKIETKNEFSKLKRITDEEQRPWPFLTTFEILSVKYLEIEKCFELRITSDIK